MTLPPCQKSGNKSLTIRYSRNGQTVTRTLTAPTIVKTIKTLIDAKAKGVTALEVSNTWAFRLGAYVFTLRHEYGLRIHTQHEAHDGGWHARYVLLTPVTIIE